MCFVVKHKKAKIATSNIVCYKVSNHPKRSNVEDYFRPYYYCSFKYLLNKRTPSVAIHIGRDWNGDHSIRDGYHSLQSFKDGWIAWERGTKKIGKFIIPKGTKYYENKTEYVSETLIFKGYIK